MKFVVRPLHIISVGGYIVETEFPYRNLIVVNPTQEPIKIDIPVFSEDWITRHEDLGLEVITIKEEETFLSNFRRAKIKLEKLKSELGQED
jgi:energy-converting hydrogenase B subunit P